MKKMLLLLIMICSLSSWATNYYVKTGGNDGLAGTSDGTAWATITKVNAYWLAGSFNPGDSILFKRGDTFVGAITVSQSGTNGNPIVCGAYGTGAKPIVTGLSTITSWTNVGGGIYSKIIAPESAPNLLLIDGVQYAMGRYPNTGWMHYESHTGTTAITDNELPTSPSFTGAEAVIRASSFVINRLPVTNHTTQTLTITNTAALTDGYGYYIQNDLDCLDQFGEWYYNAGTTTLYVYFGAVDPTTKTTQVPVINYGVTFSTGFNYITFKDIAVKGFNKRGFAVSSSNYITINSCDVSFIGNSGIRISSASYCTVINSTTNYVNDIGILCVTPANNATITGNTINNTETILAQGFGNYLSGAGIMAYQGSDILVENNTVTNTGYCGIIFGGNNEIVRNNYINNFCIFQRDGGGIYYGSQAAYSNMLVTGNIILNGIGGAGGELISAVNGAAGGIYIDYGTTGGVTISNNSIANCSGPGIWNHASSNLTITGNKVYNCIHAIHLQETPGVGVNITGMNLKSNQFIAKDLTQLSFWGRLNAGNLWSGTGTYDSNYYARPVSDATSIKAMVSDWDVSEMSLTQWKTLSGQEVHSNKSPFAVASTNYILFDYSITGKTVTGLVGYKSLSGATVTGYTLAPYESIILLTQGVPASSLIKSYGKIVKY